MGNKEDVFDLSPETAEALDREDPLASLRDYFSLPGAGIYMLGNSLGLMSDRAVAAVERIIAEWGDMAIGGWLEGEPPWFWLAERIGEEAAPLVGALADEVICTGTTTYNIHSIVSTLYQPASGRTKIIASALDFPTDIYALKSQIALRGLDWRRELVLIDGGAKGLVEESSIIEAMDETVAMAHLPSVFYRSGQLLDMEGLCAEAAKRDILIGFDCSHSVGVVPHDFSAWGVDFAVWCSYKYMCGGPGSPAFIYLNRRHFGREPGLAGWFGYVKERQFDMDPDFKHDRSAGGWQVSSPGILGAAAVGGALTTLLEAGITAIRAKSLKMTNYMIYLAEELLHDEPYGFKVVTPKEPSRRGGHVALSRPSEALRIKEALSLRGVQADFRPPGVIRFAPSPLYSTYQDVREVIFNIREVVDRREYSKIPEKRGFIS